MSRLIGPFSSNKWKQNMLWTKGVISIEIWASFFLGFHLAAHIWVHSHVYIIGDMLFFFCHTLVICLRMDLHKQICTYAWIIGQTTYIQIQSVWFKITIFRVFNHTFCARFENLLINKQYTLLYNQVQDFESHCFNISHNLREREVTWSVQQWRIHQHHY